MKGRMLCIDCNEREATYGGSQQCHRCYHRDYQRKRAREELIKRRKHLASDCACPYHDTRLRP